MKKKAKCVKKNSEDEEPVFGKGIKIYLKSEICALDNCCILKICSNCFQYNLIILVYTLSVGIVSAIKLHKGHKKTFLRDHYR